jgi:hypothetical protein
MILLINAADMVPLSGGGSIVAIVAFSILGMAVGHHLDGPKPDERARRSDERADLARVGPQHRVHRNAAHLLRSQRRMLRGCGVTVCREET